MTAGSAQQSEIVEDERFVCGRPSDDAVDSVDCVVGWCALQAASGTGAESFFISKRKIEISFHFGLELKNSRD